ncbi:MAG: hypothetical protein AAFX99_33830, partial [Myxococcota bacterium]
IVDDLVLGIGIDRSVDIRLSDSTSLLVGAFTDFSWVNDGDLDELSQIDLYGASLGLRRVSDDKISTFGLVGRYGTGKALGRDYDPATTGSILEPVTTDANVTQWSLSLVIGGTTDFGFGDDDDEPRKEAP